MLYGTERTWLPLTLEDMLRPFDDPRTIRLAALLRKADEAYDALPDDDHSLDYDDYVAHYLVEQAPDLFGDAFRGPSVRDAEFESLVGEFEEAATRCGREGLGMGRSEVLTRAREALVAFYLLSRAARSSNLS